MAFRSSASSLGASGVNNVTVNAPAGLALGDMILLAVDNENGSAITWPSGFSATYASWTISGASHGRSATGAMAWKLAGGSEPGTYTVTVATGGSGFIKCVIGAWSGRASSPGTAIVTNEAGNGVTPFNGTMTGYTAAAGDDVAFFLEVADTNTAGSWAITNATGYTAQQDLNDVGTFRGGEVNLSTKDALSAGATGNITFTATGTSLVGSAGGDMSGIMIPLPAASGGSTTPAPMYHRKNVLYFI